MDHFIFGDVDTRDYGVCIFDSQTDNAPARVYDKYEVPGRNGDVYIDRQKYENVKHVYWGVIYENYEENLRNFRSAMRSQIGYKRLQDSIHTDEFFSACFVRVLEVETATGRNMGRFQIVFDRKPQRFLLSGEEIITYPPGIFGKNLLTYPYFNTTQEKNGVQFEDNGDGTITATRVGTSELSASFAVWTGYVQGLGLPNLVNGETYIISGCPKGGNAYSNDGYLLRFETPQANYFEIGNGVTFTYDETYRYSIVFGVGRDCNADGLVFKPMIRKASDTDPTWTPYLNPSTIDNPTLFSSNPLIRVTFDSVSPSTETTLSIGSDVITLKKAFEYIDIDSEIQNCYHGMDNANSQVKFYNNKFPQLPPGLTGIVKGEGITDVKVTPRWYNI